MHRVYSVGLSPIFKAARLTPESIYITLLKVEVDSFVWVFSGTVLGVHSPKLAIAKLFDIHVNSSIL